MLLKPDRLRLQFGYAESPDGLHHIDRNRAQQAAACRVFLALIVALMGRAEHVNIHGRVDTVKKRTQLKKLIFLHKLKKRIYEIDKHRGDLGKIEKIFSQYPPLLEFWNNIKI